jgi:exopolysaccharide biosynthesis predicted pyruvyltransferase EpsI
VVTKVKAFLKRDPNELNVGDTLIMTAVTVFVTGVVTVSINTSVNAVQAIMDSRRNHV